MIVIIYSLIFILLILFLMFMINMFISKKMYKNREKVSPFECGFDPQSISRMPFSLQFYLITIIFLIFDVEIALILPMVESMSWFMMINFNIFFILLILFIGLILEWKEGALKWFN